MDSLQIILGDVQTHHVQFQLQRSGIRIFDPATGDTVETTRSEIPDLILLTASLPESPIVERDASLSVRFRGDPPFQGEPSLVWTITGMRGELRVVSPSGPLLMAYDHDDNVQIDIHSFETDNVTPLEWRWSDWQLEIPYAGRSVAALYEAFADGEEGCYPTFEDALHRYVQLDKWIEVFDLKDLRGKASTGGRMGASGTIYG